MMEDEPRGTDQPRTMRDTARDMPTPTSAVGALGLFAALELAEVEEGTQTLAQARETLCEVAKDAGPEATFRADNPNV